jgi:glycerol kinase
VETTALGAAALAGLATDVWESADEFLGVQDVSVFNPAMSEAQVATLRQGWRRAVDTTLFWAKQDKA